jgi:hypothetical protein
VTGQATHGCGRAGRREARLPVVRSPGRWWLACALGAALGVGGVGGVGGTGCAAVLDLDGYQDAVDKLCRCDEQLSFLPRCREVLSGRLGNASPATRAAWLDFFAGHCAGGCERAYECFAQRPTCSDRDMSCAATAECCGSADDASALACVEQAGQATCR